MVEIVVRLCLIVIVAVGIACGSDDCRGEAAFLVVAGESEVGHGASLTPRQRAWSEAPIGDRARIAEQLGDEGARAMAKSKRYETIFDGFDRAVPQGPDQVYRAGDGVVHVFEAKGGTGQLGHAYGYPQGSAEWAVKSARRVRSSAKATPAEKRAAQEILNAASRGKMEVHVVRTSHVQGEPMAAVLEQSAGTTPAARRMAADALNGGTKTGSAAAKSLAGSTDGAAVAVRGASGRVIRGAGKAVVVVGAAVDATLRVEDWIETERQFANGEISLEQREVAHAKNAAGMAGGWAGAFVGAKLGAAGGGAAGSCVAPGPGTAVGAVLGGGAGAVAGYMGGEAAAEATAEWVTKKVHASGTTITESVSGSWGWTTRSCHNGWQAIVGK